MIVADDETTTLVKVCGLTRPKDVALAVELGAWAVGFVLADSPRQVDADAAAALVRFAHRAAAASRPTLTVLVFTTESADVITRAVLVTHADAVQLSAGRRGAAVGAVRDSLFAVRRRDVMIIAAADAADAEAADYVLRDSRGCSTWGGTGVPLDWARLAHDPGFDRHRLVLAGGLTPANVGEAIRLVRPRVVDASSGLEQRAGVKDPGLMRAFFAAAAQADRHCRLQDQALGPSSGGSHL